MSNQEIIDKLLNGEMKLYQVDKEVSVGFWNIPHCHNVLDGGFGQGGRQKQ